MDQASASQSLPRDRSRIALNRVFAGLAAITMITAVGSLWIGQSTLHLLENQRTQGIEWTARVKQLMSLRDILAALDSPGNTVFQSHDIEGERQTPTAELLEAIHRAKTGALKQGMMQELLTGRTRLV
jgi:hypothetical protein